MYITDFYMSLIIGVVATLLFVESFGITPGGIIVASYLALVLDSPITMVLIFFNSLREEIIAFSKFWIAS